MLIEDQGIRKIRQLEAVNSYSGKYHSLLKCAPRFGKIKVTLDIFKRDLIKKALIAIPRLDIKDSWEKDKEKWGWDGEIEYTTHRSLHKVSINNYDILVIDEIHECSSNQLCSVKKINPKKVLALSGTITKKTQEEISNLADIDVCYDYPIEQAVEEGILCDYEIFIHKVALDNSKLLPNKRTEKKQFEILKNAYSKLEKEKKDSFFVYLKQISLIQNSIAKMEKTKELLSSFSGKRVLCFCGVTEIADKLGYPVYHSKNKEKGVLSNFCNGKGNCLVTIKMAQSGLTIVPINIGLINYTSGNPEDTAQKICRFLGLEYDNPEKKASIHIVVSDEDFEIDRISTALMFFDKEKVKYI